MDNSKHEPVKKKIYNDMGDKQIDCPLCNAHLFDGFAGGSDATESSGVFQLGESKFCPNCGVKFLD